MNLNLPSSTIAIYIVPKSSQIGVPPSAPPLEKNMAGRNMNISISDIALLAAFIWFLLNAWTTNIVNTTAPTIVEIVANNGSPHD